MGRRKPKSRKRKPKKGMEILPAVASSSASPPQPKFPPWIELPGDITANILQRLGAEEMLESAQKVCTAWRRVCLDPSMWRVIALTNRTPRFERCDRMCLHAVDRSQGQLVDLTIDYFGNDELINYIADRSSHLRRIQLDTCYYISGEALVEAVKKLPHLEEMHLIMMTTVEAGDVEKIGISCPMLQSFSYNECGYSQFMSEIDYNDLALAIGKSMPNLRHLRLFGHWMKNEGLQAIVDGCPHLELLDLRKCFNLDLRGDLGKRCSEQIKDLKCPSDTTRDIWWVNDDPDQWEDGRSSTFGFSDFYSFEGYDDHGYYEDFEQYDDYTSPLGFGFFGDYLNIFDDDY